MPSRPCLKPSARASAGCSVGGFSSHRTPYSSANRHTTRRTARCPADAAPLPAPITRGAGRILIMDDEALVREVAGQMLEAAMLRRRPM